VIWKRWYLNRKISYTEDETINTITKDLASSYLLDKDPPFNSFICKARTFQ